MTYSRKYFRQKIITNLDAIIQNLKYKSELGFKITIIRNLNLAVWYKLICFSEERSVDSQHRESLKSEAGFLQLSSVPVGEFGPDCSMEHATAATSHSLLDYLM
jgi:hypothetical protein